MAHSVLYHPSVVERDLPNLDPSIRARIFKAIERKLAPDPWAFGKPLRSALAYFRSLRVGDYRVVYAVERERIFILAIGHRSKIYDLATTRS